MSSGGGGDQLVGYWYAVGMHMVCCHSQGDVVIERIMVGDRIAWSQGASANTSIYIDQPNLFGGEEREGGVQGSVDLMFGGQSQPPNDYLVDRCGGGPPVGDPNLPPLASGLIVDELGRVFLPDGTQLFGYNLTTTDSTPGLSGVIPAFRGVLSVVLRQCWVAAMNPYIKIWSFLVNRYPKTLGTPLSQINTDANPAAIIAECLIDEEWGLGYSTNDLDIDAFTAAATTLLAEGFGLSFAWSKQQTVDEFISHILSTVDGYRYTDPTTGKIGIKLARFDYDPNTLLVLDDSNIDTVSQFARPDPSDIINQVALTFIERPAWAELDADGNPTGQMILKNVDRSITVHNGASIELLGQVNATSIDYPGIPNIGLASRVAMRELASRSRGIATVKLVATRFASQLKGGDVFKFNWPALGITNMVLRVTEIDYGLLTDGRVTVSAVEDVFSLPQTTYIGTDGSQWKEPIENVKQITNAVLFELPYFLVITQLASDNDQAVATLPDGYAFLGVIAARQQSTATNFSLWDNGKGTYTENQRGGFTPLGQLAADIDENQTTLTVTWLDLTNFLPNSYALLDDEWVQIQGVSGNVVTFMRGIWDSVPAKHSASATLWLAGGNVVMDRTTFLSGQTLGVKLQARTTRGEMLLSTVATRSITFNGRAQRPYPPGNIRVNDLYRPSRIIGGLQSIKWSHRNRLTQTAGPIAQTTGDIAPEAGVTYTITLKQRTDLAAAWVTVETASAITANTYVPTQVFGDTWIRIEIKSVRGGLDSYQTQILELEQAGFGVGFGNYFGGF